MIYTLLHAVLFPLLTVAGWFGGRELAQTKIGEDTTFTYGVFIAAIGGAIYIAVMLTNIRRDISQVKWRINHLPCQRGEDCERKSDA